jgi:hypothetical protein
MDNDRYKLRHLVATVGAMKESEVKTEPKRSSATLTWKIVSTALLITVILLASLTALQYNSINDLTSAQQSLSDQIQRLQTYGAGSDKVLNFFKNVTKLDTTVYTVSLDDNEVVWRTDIGGVSEETLKYNSQKQL